ncbi:MAG: type IV restriction endonuclease, partial [Anaerolineae bacterium]|nr:type IV restriction endonuclease [Anaerolineae bacterium]
MPIPQTVLNLIQRFADNADAYRSAQYNEAQVREEFITPFFAALGWDVYNQKGASEKYKQVVHEAAVKVGGATKAPDYAFRLGGQRV